MLRCWPVLLVWLAACGGKTSDGESDTNEPNPTDTDLTDTDDPTGEPCTATVASVEPGNNGQMPADGVITVTFSEAIEASDPLDIVVEPADGGSAVSGSVDLVSGGTAATFTPSAPLAYETDYDVTISVCEEEVSGSISTLPQPLDAALLEGRTYGLLIDDVTWNEPSNLDLLDLNLDYVLVQVTQVDLVNETIEPIATTGEQSQFVGEPPTPDCASVVDAPTTDFSTNPLFQVGPTDLTYPYGNGTDITIEDFALAARFSADGSEIVDVRVTGLFDPSQLIDIDCATAAFLTQGRCLPCSTGECIVVDAEAPSAAWFDGLDVVAQCGL